MNNPTVCAVMLVNGREAMVRRAVQCFRKQTYKRKMLVIYDTTPHDMTFDIKYPEARIVDEWPTDERSNLRSIGALRNGANGHVDEDIIVHWDSDDWSHPRRIEEQVALLQASGKQCVGYRDMLFWRQNALKSYASTHPDDCTCGTCGPGQRTVVVGEHDLGSAWLYTNRDTRYCLGTSLCYWRSAWEGRPFPDQPKSGAATGEDNEWLREIDSVGFTSFLWKHPDGGPTTLPSHREDDRPEPRMIASVHGGNTQPYADVMIEGGPNWRRAPEWQNYCRERMTL